MNHAAAPAAMTTATATATPTFVASALRVASTCDALDGTGGGNDDRLEAGATADADESAATRGMPPPQDLGDTGGGGRGSSSRDARLPTTSPDGARVEGAVVALVADGDFVDPRADISARPRQGRPLEGGDLDAPRVLESRCLVGEGGELEERLLDELVDDARLRRPVSLALAHRALHQVRDVEGADGDRVLEEELREVEPKVSRRLISLRGLTRERAIDDALEIRRHARVDFDDARNHRLLDLLDGLEVGVAEEEPLASEELPEDDADGEDVGAGVDFLSHGGFGRQVREFALDDARLALFELAVRLGETEVHDLHFAVLRDEHVRRRHVAVDDVERNAVRIGELVGVREALADLERDVDGGFDREVALVLLQVLDDGFEVRPVDELHDDEEGVVADADVEHLHAVRVRELRGEARLVEEHGDELLLRREVRQNALNRDLLAEALEAFALGAEHFGHTARLELFDNSVTLLGVRHGAAGGLVPKVPSVACEGQGRLSESWK